MKSLVQWGSSCVMNSTGVTRRAISHRGTVTTWCQRDRPRGHCDAKIDMTWNFGCASWAGVLKILPSCLSVSMSFPCANYRMRNVFVSFGLWLHLLSVCLTGDITRNYFLWIWKCVCTRTQCCFFMELVFIIYYCPSSRVVLNIWQWMKTAPIQ